MSHYRSILLIDDDTEDQEIFLDAVKEVDPGVHCVFANDAEEALKQLNEEILLRPDMLFIDLNMPKINGKQLLKEIKKSEHLKGIPVIMYSTFFGPKDIEEITSLGAVHYMIKATRFIELCNSLKYILSKNWY
jgi:CheY-like chemotaxis protein